MSAHAFSSSSSSSSISRTDGKGVGIEETQEDAEEGGEGVPLLRDSLGALACTLETSLDLGSEVITMDSSAHDGDASTAVTADKTGSQVDEAGEAGSRLFIARVDAVEGVEHLDSLASTDGGVALGEGEESRLPLLYWRLGFTTVKDES